MATPTSGRAATIVIQASVAVGDRRSRTMKLAMSTTQTTCATLSRSPQDKVIEATLTWLVRCGLPPRPRFRYGGSEARPTTVVSAESQSAECGAFCGQSSELPARRIHACLLASPETRRCRLV